MSLEVMGSAQGAYQSIRPQSSTPVETSSYQTSAPQQAVTPVAVSAPNESGQQRQQSFSSEGRQPSDKDIQAAIDMANKQTRFRHTNAQFAYHEETKMISVKIIDNDTQEVIREIPSEETLDFISKIYDLLGMVVDEKR